MCNEIRPNHEARCYETLIQSKLSNCSNDSENAKFHIVHVVSVIKSIQPFSRFRDTVCPRGENGFQSF